MIELLFRKDKEKHYERNLQKLRASQADIQKLLLRLRQGKEDEAAGYVWEVGEKKKRNTRCDALELPTIAFYGVCGKLFSSPEPQNGI